MQKIVTYLWFDDQAEEAVELYMSIFKDGKVLEVSRYPEGVPGREAGAAMIVDFELFGLHFIALNGGPQFKFTEAMSLLVNCEDQEEVDKYWDALTADGGEESMCGWLKDKYGVSWQIIPKQLSEYLGNSDPKKAQAATQAMLKMKKIVLKDLKEAADKA